MQARFGREKDPQTGFFYVIFGLMLNLDRDKYRQIAQSKGLSAAMTQLHLDYGLLEFDSFEGEKGYQPQMWKDLAELRAFSVELWDTTMSEGPVKKP
jgi:hypothetical protein